MSELFFGNNNMSMAEYRKKGLDKKIENVDEEFDTIAAEKANLERKKKHIGKYRAKDELKKSLLAECLLSMLENSLGLTVQQNQFKNMKRNLVESFIDSNSKGVDSLIETMKYTSIPCANLAFLVEEYTDKIFENVEGFDEEYNINCKEKEEFYNKLKNCDTSDISTLVQTRVLSAIEDFTQSNRNVKNDLKDNIEKIQSKINENTPEDIKEAMQISLKRINNEIQSNKPKNIFECMIEAISKAALKDNMSGYINEGGRLNMLNIFNNTKVMYTFMEMLNTAKLEKIDKAYITDVLETMNMNNEVK